MHVFYEIMDIPVHSVLLLPTREKALNYPKGHIRLAFCPTCGFISNAAFDTSLHEYSSRYEETQGFSPTFHAFHQRLALYLIKRYNLHKKHIIEIGCGKGEFLNLLCELGDNYGVGFDPAYVSERNSSSLKNQTTFIKDFYSEKYANYKADFVCCKMTLEHIQNTAHFIKMVCQCVGDNPGSIIFFQVPDVQRILDELAFWDIYYEHCSYFSAGSLAFLFRICGLDIIDLWKEYGDQYLMIASRPRRREKAPSPENREDLEKLKHAVELFSEKCRSKLHSWKQTINQFRLNKEKAVLWGSGSKAVSFLTTLEMQDGIEYVVDINPYKIGMYMAGTGQQIVGTEFLKEYKPDIVIIMNPIYQEEIRQDINKMNMTPRIMAV
jgi:SAM-dependent methyltransferase